MFSWELLPILNLHKDLNDSLSRVFCWLFSFNFKHHLSFRILKRMMFRLSHPWWDNVPGGYLPKLTGTWWPSLSSFDPARPWAFSLAVLVALSPEKWCGSWVLPWEEVTEISVMFKHFLGQILMSIKTHRFFKLGRFSQKPHHCLNILVMLKLFHAVSSHCSTANLLPS